MSTITNNVTFENEFEERGVILVKGKEQEWAKANDSLKNGTKRQRFDFFWRTEHIGDDMFIFAIWNLRSTVHDTHMHAVLFCPQHKLMTVRLLIAPQLFRLA